MFYNTIKYDLLAAYRQPGTWLHGLFFYILVVSLFPLAIGPDKQQLIIMAPGIFLLATVLATLLALQKLFQQDYDDGLIQQLKLSPHSFTWILMAKLVSQWLIASMPLILASPLLALLLGLSFHTTSILVLSLLLTTPTLILIGAIGVAVTISIRETGLLLILLILPLYVPILIFATSTISASIHGIAMAGQIAVLSALLLMAIVFVPLVLSAIFKMQD